MQLRTSGPTCPDAKATYQIRRALNQQAGQIAEKSLAKALQGDAQALLACAVLLLVAATQKGTK